MKKRIIVIGICLLIAVGAIAFVATRRDSDTNNTIENASEVVTDNNETANENDAGIETPIVEGNNEVAQQSKPKAVTNKKSEVVNSSKINEVIIEDDDDDDDNNPSQPVDDRTDGEFPVLEGNDNEIIGDNEMSPDTDGYLERMQAALKKMYEHSSLPKVRIIN